MDKKIEIINSKILPLIRDNIDTDQIIPARFLKIITKDGLGKQLFADLRYDQDGNPNPGFILNQPEAQSAHILLTGENFGCGSSREHAPWALRAFGFQAIIAKSFADIFRNNAIKNGILPICLPEADFTVVQDTLIEIPDAVVKIDIHKESITLPTGEILNFKLDHFTKQCFIDGIDELQYLLSHIDAIKVFEVNCTTG